MNNIFSNTAYKLGRIVFLLHEAESIRRNTQKTGILNNLMNISRMPANYFGRYMEMYHSNLPTKGSDKNLILIDDLLKEEFGDFDVESFSRDTEKGFSNEQSSSFMLGFAKQQSFYHEQQRTKFAITG